MTTPTRNGLTPGDEVEVEVGPVAHGGHCVARHEGQVLFVRHALPGERVLARVTGTGPKGRFLRADAVSVVTASPDRVEAPCAYAGPGRCGGCDFQHVTMGAQRELKTAVVREQFSRLAGIEVDVEVEALPGDDGGLKWRTRVEFAVDDTGRAGLRAHRSHEVVPVGSCLIADPRVVDTGVLGRSWPGETAVDVVAPSVGEPVVVPVPSSERTAPTVTEHVGAQRFSADFEVSARGFWQVHPGAAVTFVDTVLAMVQPRPGETALDLYAGVGLFAAALAAEVGDGGRVVAVESDPSAVASAQVNLAAYPFVLAVRGRVDDALGVPRPARSGPGPRRGRRPSRPRPHPLIPPAADIVVLDPPRTGAGRDVAGAIVRLRPRAIAYVACDPAALARDTAFLREGGYPLAGLRAFDAFPMTHHVECVALFTPSG